MKLVDAFGYGFDNLELAVQRGIVKDSFIVWKFGRNELVNTDETDIWIGGGSGTTYIFPSTSGVVSIASNNIGDTSINITIEGLDSNWDIASETISTDASDGTTPVAGSTSFIRVNRAYNSNGINLLGNVTCSIGGSAVAYIPSGVNQTLQSIYSIPAGYTGYLFKGMASTSKGKDAQIFFKFRLFGNVFRTAETFGLYQSSYEGNRPYLPFPEKTDLRVSAISSSSSTDVHAGFGLILIKGK